MDNQFFSMIYNGTIKTLISDFSEKEIPEVLQSYQLYIIENYSNVLEPTDNVEKVAKLFIEIENKKWKNKTKEEKQILIMKDPALENLRYLSGIAQKYAQNRLGNELSSGTFIAELSEEQAQNYIKNLEEYTSQVKPYNSLIAQTYLSEGIIDFLYASKLSDNMSLRVGRLK